MTEAEKDGIFKVNYVYTPTQREYFAVHVLQGLIGGRRNGLSELLMEQFIKESVETADALIKELNKNKG